MAGGDLKSDPTVRTGRGGSGGGGVWGVRFKFDQFCLRLASEEHKNRTGTKINTSLRVGRARKWFEVFVSQEQLVAWLA